MEEELFSNIEKPEYILCAAIHFDDGVKHEHQPRNIKSGFVVCGRRHHNCYITAFIINGNESMAHRMNEANGKATQGFLTSTDRFLDRKQSALLAVEQKQTYRDTDLLFSEDLY